jgi:hypothetical protein
VTGSSEPGNKTLVPYNVGNFQTSERNIVFSTRALLHGIGYLSQGGRVSCKKPENLWYI